MARTQYCTFVLDGMLFGIPVMMVQEVLREQGTTRVPLAPPLVRGLINLRGQIVTAIDLRERLGLPPRPPGAPTMTIVVHAGDGAVACLVDAIGDVLELDDDGLERPPETLRGAVRDLLPGAHKLDQQLLLVLDAARAVGHAAAA